MNTLKNRDYIIMELFIIALLFVLGIVMLVVEIALIPGVGITGIIGVLSLISSIIYTFMSMGAIAGWIMVAITVVVSIILFRWAASNKTYDKMALKKNIDSKVANADAKKLKVGDLGVATTRLALIGEAEFEAMRAEVKSSDGFIDEGARIVVERIVGEIVFVKKAE